MTPQQIIAVAVRLFAIWLLLYAGASVTSSYLAVRAHGAEIPIQSLASGFALVVIVCGILWAFPLFIARWILPRSVAQPEQSAAFQDWFSVGCSLIGVWILAKAISALASNLLVDYLGYRIFPNSFIASPDWPLYVAYNFFQLTFGIWLLLGGKGLRKLVQWGRRDF